MFELLGLLILTKDETLKLLWLKLWDAKSSVLELLLKGRPDHAPTRLSAAGGSATGRPPWVVARKIVGGLNMRFHGLDHGTLGHASHDVYKCVVYVFFFNETSCSFGYVLFCSI